MAVLGVVFVAGALGSAPAPDRPVALIVDRTLVCTTEVHGGVRLLTVDAQSSARGLEDLYGRPLLANAFLHTGGPVISGSLGPVISGGQTLVRTAAGGRRPSTVAINRRCRATHARVAFSTRRLQGGAASEFHDTFQCYPARTIVVRMRAEFKASATLRRAGDYLQTGVAARKAEFAVRTESGKALVYAHVSESGKARLFTAESCFPD